MFNEYISVAYHEHKETTYVYVNSKNFALSQLLSYTNLNNT